MPTVHLDMMNLKKIGSVDLSGLLTSKVLVSLTIGMGNDIHISNAAALTLSLTVLIQTSFI